MCRMQVLRLLALAVGMSGCGSANESSDSSTEGDDGPDVPEVAWDVEPPPGNCPTGWTCRNLLLPAFKGVDILAVVDNSASMSEEQEAMAEQFPRLIEDLLWPVLSPYTGKPVSVPINDVHIGIVSSDMGVGGHEVATCVDSEDGDDGVLLSTPYPYDPTCEDDYPEWLTYDEDAPVPEEVDGMGDSFACVSRLGTEGCGFEQQLEAALKALTVHSEPGGPNEGFLRGDTMIVVIWLTDEGDCSTGDPGIFDLADEDLGPANLRCYEHGEMLYPVSRYAEGLAALRAGSPWPVFLAMIVGVPPGEPACNGYGNLLDGCLSTGPMQYVPTELDGVDVPTPSCETDNGRAYPPGRFVELAQSFGSNAYVHSICQDDYMPALDAIGRAVSSLSAMTCNGYFIQLDKAPTDDCLCTTDCKVVHALDGTGSCPSGMSPLDWDEDGNADTVTDASGRTVTACEVPHAGTVVDSCERLCHDPLQHTSPLGTGWYYTLAGDGVACPSLAFTEGMGTPPGGYTFVACPE